ncbi:MAG: orotidine-5'-phosphate decarboxylase [Gammaproteobacteria bacterium]|nr:orotidine-5'-phosphate decarboxylase [Gammaproteobacteria bacterium]MDD9851591.1 orotidine-5'-phosphate decarboxylase [Gammaproteobacteria bacterium]
MPATRDRLIVALDLPTAKEARELVLSLGDAAGFYKIGLELFMGGEYFSLMEWLRARGKKIFVDLKFFDVPATVARAVARLNGRGVEFVTVHGNDAMMRAAAEAAGDVKVLAVTALTSLDRGDLDDLGFDCDIAQLVLSRAQRARQHGCAGVIASPREAPQLRAALGDGLLIVTPGIRPLVNDQAGDDQKRTADVRAAIAGGADYIVVGRPIRDAADPARAAQEIQKQIAAHLKP